MMILAVGGGTLGPVTPLIATWKAIKKQHPSAKLVWVGTPTGPEGELIKAMDVPFYVLPVAKWPRYPSLHWVTFPMNWLRAKREAGRLLDKYQPDVVMSAGGFTAVPLIEAARARHIPCVAHQLDLVPGLSNKKIASACDSVTTSFEYERPPFGERVSDERIATPTFLRLADLPSKQVALRSFGFHAKKPVVFVMGGGSGSLAINAMVHRELKTWLSFTQVLHSTGIGKQEAALQDRNHEGYHAQELFSHNLEQAYAAADVIIARGGIGTLSEASALKKPLIVIPLPDSPQEANAKAAEERSAVIVIHQNGKYFDGQVTKTLQLLLRDKDLQQSLAQQLQAFFPTDDGSALAERVLRVVKK